MSTNYPPYGAMAPEGVTVSNVISARLDAEIRAALQAEADERGIPLAEVVRERVSTKRTLPPPGGNVVYFAPGGRHEELRASLEYWGGRQTASIRVWFEDGPGNWRPGKRGINCTVDRLPLLAKAVGALLAERGPGE